VQAEGSARGGGTGALEPPRLVLMRLRVRRTDERGDREPAGLLLLEACERGPGPVVERALDMARDGGGRTGGHRGIELPFLALARRSSYLLIAALAAVPRLAVLLHERSAITAAYVDKGSDFARTFLASGTYGFIPGHPSAYTQPLYGFFLVPLYWIFGRSWVVVGLAQIAVAVATALLVYEIGRRFVSRRAGLLAAAVATLHPYLVWHDVHMNREILDELLAAAVVLLTLLVAERLSVPLAVGLGVALGLAVLGNVRLVLLPALIAVFLVACARRAAVVPAVVAVAFSALVVAPWAVRNQVSVGCFTLTTDGRALWKANNPNTLRTLRHGRWIDDVPGIPGAPPTPQDAGAIYRATGRVVPTDECAQMHYYRHLALTFMREHPGEKTKLAALGAQWLWQPSVTRTEGRSGAGTSLDVGRSVIEPLFMVVLYALALAGLFLVPRRLAVLAALLLAYDTLAAMLFAGETRYRVPWDFLIALLAAAAALRLHDFVRRRVASATPNLAAPRTSEPS
jgi:4-amino-4-deoxy-L-arabinose transferase-like glycosyltransferase